MDEKETKCFENHSQDARYTDMGDCAPTCHAQMGTGGNNVPLVVNGQKNEDVETLRMREGCAGGGKGPLISKGVSLTLAVANDQALFEKHDAEGFTDSGHGDYWKGEEASGTIRAEGENRPSRPSNIVCEKGDGCLNPHDPQTARIFETEGAFHTLNANNGGGQSREGILCVHGSQDPINNPGDQHEEPIFDCAVCGHFGEARELNASEFIDRTSMEISTPFPLEELEAFKAVMYGCPKCDTWYPSKKMWNDEQVTHTVEQRVLAAIDGDKINKQERKGGSGLGIHTEDVGYTNTAKDVHGVATEQTAGMLAQLTVRRLLPVETERLMGFSDGHTQIPWKGKPAEECPDSPRYKACGNSMCVNCMEWIGRRIQMEEDKINNEECNNEKK